MKTPGLLLRTATSVALTLIALAASAADYPAPKEGDWIARDFRFHTGEVMAELRLHYTTQVVQTVRWLARQVPEIQLR